MCVCVGTDALLFHSDVIERASEQARTHAHTHVIVVTSAVLCMYVCMYICVFVCIYVYIEIQRTYVRHNTSIAMFYNNMLLHVSAHLNHHQADFVRKRGEKKKTVYLSIKFHS